MPAWSGLSAYDRAARLYRAHELMMERRKTLAETMTREQGKPFKAAMNEVKYGADFLLWFAEEAKRVYGETIPSARGDQRFLVHKQAVGVVAAITPWNYPVSMITRKVAPAIAAGCTIVLKPAESTPLCAMAVFEILHEAGIPAGVVNLVTAADPVPIGEEFCTNPLVRKLTFTGSTAVGKKLARDAAPQLKRVSMELGRSRTVHRVRRCRPGPRRQGCLAGQVPQYRAGLVSARIEFLCNAAFWSLSCRHSTTA